MPTIVQQRFLEGVEQGKTIGLTQGIQQGLTQGRQWIGQIQTLQELLGQPVSPSAELTARSIAELTELAGALKAAVQGKKL